MATTVKPDSDQSGFVDGVDRHYYQNQVGAGSPFDDTYAFRWAAAVAKDRARHNLIRAVQKADEEARSNRSVSQEAGDIFRGTPSGKPATRSIDGVAGASDNSIKL